MAAFSGVIALNYCWSSFTAARDLDPRGAGHEVEAMLRAIPAEAFPLTAGVAAEMGAYGSEAHYELVLSALIDGPGVAGIGSADGGASPGARLSCD